MEGRTMLGLDGRDGPAARTLHEARRAVPRHVFVSGPTQDSVPEATEAV